jgi:hypothetical protein
MARWRMKTGVGAHYQFGRRIVPGQTVEATRRELGAAVSKFELLGADDEDTTPRVTPKAVPSDRSPGQYEIVHGTTGGRINDEPLPEDPAREAAPTPGSSVPEGAAREAAPALNLSAVASGDKQTASGATRRRSRRARRDRAR